MKLILARKYDGPWSISALDYKTDKSPRVTDTLYLLFRNAAASVNSYEIVDVEIDDKEQVISCQCRIWSYKDWAKEIFRIVKFFEDSYQKVPNILVANDETFRKIDAQSTHKVKGLIGTNYKLKFCLDSSLEVDEYKLIYDEQAVIK